MKYNSNFYHTLSHRYLVSHAALSRHFLHCSSIVSFFCYLIQIKSKCFQFGRPKNASNLLNDFYKYNKPSIYKFFMYQCFTHPNAKCIRIYEWSSQKLHHLETCYYFWMEYGKADRDYNQYTPFDKNFFNFWKCMLKSQWPFIIIVFRLLMRNQQVWYSPSCFINKNLKVLSQKHPVGLRNSD